MEAKSTSSRSSMWALIRFLSALLLAFSLCFAALFVATLAGIYETSYGPWQFLNAQPRVWTGAQIGFQTVLWACVYAYASRRVPGGSRSSSKLNSGTRL